MKNLAVIDLGSNTFHLLIIQVSDRDKFDILYRKRIFTGLSEGGVAIIKDSKIEEGLEAIRLFKKILRAHGNPTLKVIGTAVLRKASNRQVFIEQAEAILDTPITIIDGIKEAHYIYKGTTLHKELQIGSHLIMDIGGGSTEFILINNGEKIWSNSYPLGVGILYERFHKTDPINLSDLHNLFEYVKGLVSDLPTIIAPYHPLSLTGASGSFEILQLMTFGHVNDHQLNFIENNTFLAIYDQIINADETQRQQMKGLPIERVKLIVVGMALKRAIYNIVQPEKLIVSPYALKEGVLREMLDAIEA